jgi:hypothetical protein
MIQKSISNTKFHPQLPTSQPAKIAQQGKQMILGAQKGFEYNSENLAFLANGYRYEIDSNIKFFKSGNVLYSYNWIELS